MNVLFLVVVLFAFLFAFTNGMTNGGGLASTVIMTHAMEPFPALLLVAAGQILGLLFLGGAVARKLAYDFMILPHELPATERLWLMILALMGALVWNSSMGRLGMPNSSTHALIGGLAGAAIARFGWASVHWSTFARIFLFLGAVPLAGILLSAALSAFIEKVGAYLTPAAGRVLEKLQVAALGGAALTHGSNDGQKSVAVILLAVPAAMGSPSSREHFFLLLAIGLCLAAGAIFGSRATIRTVGSGFYRLQNVEGFCAEVSAMFLIGGSSWAGYPMSTSQVMSASILGAGVVSHPGSVRWTLVRDMVLAWFVTIPAAAVIAALGVKILEGCHVVS